METDNFDDDLDLIENGLAGDDDDDDAVVLSPVESAKRVLRDNAPFAVVNFGTLERVEVVPRPAALRHDEAATSSSAAGVRRGYKLEPPLNALPFGPPPVFPKTKEALLEYVESPERLPIFDLDKNQSFLERKPDPTQLFHWDLTPVRSAVKVVRDPTTGAIQGFREEFLDSVGETSKNSLAMGRHPGPPDQGVKGKKENLPFWPGGLELGETVGWLKKRKAADQAASAGESGQTDGGEKEAGSEEILDVSNESAGREIFETDFLTIAPGMDEGLVFSEEGRVAVTQRKTLQEIIAEGDSLEFEASDAAPATAEEAPAKEAGRREREEDSELDKIMSKVEVLRISQVSSDDVELGALRSSNAPSAKAGASGNWEWAVAVNVFNEPVDDFHQRIPEMAYKWPFELDIFQKQAILHLESHQSVFVAAHTSAGKTVIAEYAIALSLKHMTKAIYTSPIKALSNQKFRDFKTTFEDVGLITGDVQINQKAACLIMTTEILRSMLYNGSDVIRDLEWVIFDEVHYINDSERGVVWEEVLIMLPQHVNIVLLSATVPNTLEFADWVGRTKKKKIYVISTLKRPVPLEHFLYTGNSQKTMEELFLVLDSSKQFLTQGHQKALAAKKERESKSKESHGAKGPRGGDPRQEKNIYLSIVEMLRKKERLPCVIFTFSKKRVDDNAAAITTVDLTTKEEKNEIHIFFNKSISRLRVKADRDLPQILHVGHLLKRGIGVHHSGILPILKEVVEMLFQKGLVKILFATETFAMGVNMPARTVVYDSLKKHDGTGLRFLQPGEYTQMAGRAGRRGLDKTGMVIILCKGDVYEASDLHRVMLGKPFKLESQFRLTYSMILNLLRVEQLRVEDMMKRSFSEFHNQRKKGEFETQLSGVKERLSLLVEVECAWCSSDLDDYYCMCEEFWRERNELMTNLMFYSHVHKALAHGRVIVFRGDKVDDGFTHPQRRQQVGVILNAFGEAADRKFTVLTIDDGAHRDDSDDGPRAVEPVLRTRLFYPHGTVYHRLVIVKAVDLLVIAHKTIQVESDKIIDNVKKREMPRFAMDPPGKSVVAAVDLLSKLTLDNPDGLEGFDYRRELKTKDIDIVQQLESVAVMREKLLQGFVCVNCDRFQSHLDQTAFNHAVRKEFQELRYRLSDESLQLLPEYDQRLNVLKELKYVDRETGAVQLKGRISCEINNYELMITELILQNVLTPLEPNEIAALMSSMVCQEKRCSEPELNDVLLKGKAEFQRVAREIGEIQKQCGLKEPVEDFVEQFRFGLAEVVFEWAKGTPFGDICNLTDVQEGVIVRCIQRLDETCRDVKNAARLVGDPVLTSKMEQASNLIKRDIVFAASLYTQ